MPRPYQFWTKTGPDGTFRIPHVIAGSNYTLWAFGPGAAGTFLSQNQTGGSAPLELDVPAKPFAVTVTAGTPTDLGIVTWTPQRVGATVFELGYPDRKADKFRHGEDYWVPEPSPKLGYVTPIWGGEREFVLDNPNGLTYTVGQNQWPRDWSYIIPEPPDATGVYQPGTGTITFNLPAAPAADAKASVYLACAGDESGGVIVSINGTNLGSAPNVTAAPNPVTEAGFDPPATYSDDSAEHFSDHGPFFDERINFPGSLLHAGANTLSIKVAGKEGHALPHARLPAAGVDRLRAARAGQRLGARGERPESRHLARGGWSDQLQHPAQHHAGIGLFVPGQRRGRSRGGQRAEPCELYRHHGGQRHGLFLRRPIGESHRHQPIVDAERGRHSAGDDFRQSARDARRPEGRHLRPSSRFR